MEICHGTPGVNRTPVSQAAGDKSLQERPHLSSFIYLLPKKMRAHQHPVPKSTADDHAMAARPFSFTGSLSGQLLWITMRFPKTSELVLSSLSLIYRFKQARKAAALASSPSFSPCPQNVLLLSSIPPAEGDAAHVFCTRAVPTKLRWW